MTGTPAGTPGERLTLPDLLATVELVDDFLDSHRSPEYLEQPLANDWARITKVCSEAGEVMDALSKRTGENYRKGVCVTEDALLAELGDCVTGGHAGHPAPHQGHRRDLGGRVGRVRQSPEPHPGLRSLKRPARCRAGG